MRLAPRRKRLQASTSCACPRARWETSSVPARPSASPSRRNSESNSPFRPLYGPEREFCSHKYSFLGCFQADGVDEVVEGLHDSDISPIEGSDLFFGDGLVRSKGLQNAGSQRRIDFFIELQEHQTDLIAVGKQAVASGMRDFFHQSFGAQLPKVISEGCKLVLFRGHAECL